MKEIFLPIEAVFNSNIPVVCFKAYLYAVRPSLTFRFYIHPCIPSIKYIQTHFSKNTQTLTLITTFLTVQSSNNVLFI